MINGSEKQVSLAKDILARHTAGITAKLEGSLYSEKQKAVFSARLQWLKDQTDAATIIKMAKEDLWDTIGLSIPDDED